MPAAERAGLVGVAAVPVRGRPGWVGVRGDLAAGPAEDLAADLVGRRAGAAEGGEAAVT